MSELQQKHSSHRSTVSSPTPETLETFKRTFPERHFVRLHMTILLLGVGLAGLIASKVLFELGIRSMLVRYLIAVSASYAFFFVLMRIWLSYVGAVPKDDSPNKRDVGDAIDICDVGVGVGDAIDIHQVPLDVVSDGAGSELSGAPFGGGGGDFGGGGASDMWGDSTAAPESIKSAMGTTGRESSSASKSGGWDFDLGDEGIVLLVLGLLLLVIFGAGGYLIYAAPEILAEAAFEALLAAGLIKASRKITRRGWMGSVLRATWIPFIVVLLMTGAFGWVAEKYYPEAGRLSDIFNSSSKKR